MRVLVPAWRARHARVALTARHYPTFTTARLRGLAVRNGTLANVKLGRTLRNNPEPAMVQH
jgi:hypothetical protein